MVDKDVVDSLKQISANLETINKTLRESKHEDKVTTSAEDWKKRVENLIRRVDCECKRKFFTRLRIAVLAFSIGVFIVMIFLLIWLNLTVSNAILTYAKMLPSGNQTQPDSQLGFLVEQMPSFASLSISISVLILAMSAFLLPTFRASTPEESANCYYGKLSKDFDVKDRQYLKALINMKCKEIESSLLDNYQNCIRLNCNLFSEELLLKSLYQRQ
jgi:hypothetical protein